MRASSIGRPLKPTKPALAPIPDRNLTSGRRRARGGSVAPGHRPVAVAAGGCAPTIAAPTPRPATIAPARRSSRVGASTASLSAACRSTKRSAAAFLAAVQPAAIDAALAAAEQLEADGDAALAQWRHEVERKRYRANEPNGATARSIPTTASSPAGSKPNGSRACATWPRPRPSWPSASSSDDAPRPINRRALGALGADLRRVWAAPSTSDRDRKELLRSLLEEVVIAVDRAKFRADLTLRWRGGAITEIEVGLPRSNPPTVRTDEDTIALVRRLAAHYPDPIIAGILNRQGRRTARGHRFTATLVGNLRRSWKIPRFEPAADPSEGPLVNVRQAAKILGIAPSTAHRWLNDGFIAGEQLTPGAPWRIRLTDDLRRQFVDQIPDGYLPVRDAIDRLGVSRQTVLQRVKRGELAAVHVRCGKRKGLCIRVVDQQPDLFIPRT